MSSFGYLRSGPYLIVQLSKVTSFCNLNFILISMINRVMFIMVHAVIVI